MDKLNYIDMFGNPIKVGDYVVYSAVDGRSGVLRAGRVIKLTSGPGGWRDGDVPKILVNGISCDFECNKFSKLMKKTTLSFLSRVTVVPETLISPEAKKLIDE